MPTETLTDDVFRAFAEASPALGTLLPLLGRDLRHSAAKAERVLGWRPRPAVETIVDAAHSLVSSVPGR